MMPSLSSLMASEVVITTTSGATSDGKVGDDKVLSIFSGCIVIDSREKSSNSQPLQFISTVHMACRNWPDHKQFSIRNTVRALLWLVLVWYGLILPYP